MSKKSLMARLASQGATARQAFDAWYAATYEREDGFDTEEALRNAFAAGMAFTFHAANEDAKEGAKG